MKSAVDPMEIKALRQVGVRVLVVRGWGAPTGPVVDWAAGTGASQEWGA